MLISMKQIIVSKTPRGNKIRCYSDIRNVFWFTIDRSIVTAFRVDTDFPRSFNFLRPPRTEEDEHARSFFRLIVRGKTVFPICRYIVSKSITKDDVAGDGY